MYHRLKEEAKEVSWVIMHEESYRFGSTAQDRQFQCY